MNRQDIPLAFRNIIGDVRSVHIPKQGHTSEVMIIETTKGDFVIKKTNHPLFNTWLKQEYDVLTQLESCTLPIPKPFRFHEEEDQCWLLMSRIPGVSLRDYLRCEHDPANRKRIIRQFGETLRAIHTTQCPEGFKKGEPWIIAKLNEAEYNLDHYEVDGNRELLDQLKANIPASVPNTFIHGDFTIDNVLVHGAKIVGVIDWGSAAFGDPRYDLSLAIRPKPSAFETETEQMWFMEAYGLVTLTRDEYEYFANGLYAFF